jgi:hypothetical protein
MTFEIFKNDKQYSDKAKLKLHSAEIRELKEIMLALEKEGNDYAVWQVRPYDAREIAKLIGVRHQLSIKMQPKSNWALIALKGMK